MKLLVRVLIVLTPFLLVVNIVHPYTNTQPVSILSYPPSIAEAQDITLPRPLDFSPFATALDEFDSQRLAEVHPLIFEKNIPEIQSALENGDFTSVELTLYYLSRIRQYDANQLRSVLELNPDALELAQMLDEERANNEIRGPLHGIPVLIKDNIGTGDKLHTTNGAVALMDAYSDRDAFIVAQLRDAGAIILGKANLSEWDNFISSRLPHGFSALGGQTLNPYGASLNPEGSSTGSAVSVSANFAMAALGTETLGAIMAPSAANSVVGMYPSVGLLSRDRIIPISEYMDTAGPITRNITDLAILLTVLAGEDPNDPYTSDAAALAGTDFTQYLDENALRDKHVLVVITYDANEETYINKYFTQQVFDSFISAGAELSFIEEPFFEVDVMPLFFYGAHVGVDAYLADTNAPVQTLAEIVALNAENRETYIPYGQDLMQQTSRSNLEPDEIIALAQSNRSLAREKVRGLLSEYDADVIVFIDYHMMFWYTSAGFPAMTVPGGYRQSGQPFGITFMGDYLSDGELIGYAYAFEQASLFRQPPPIGEN